jgi:uncharacterized protein DUF6152
MRHQLAAAIAFLTLAVSAVPLRAHHVFEGQYDKTKPVHLTGKVTATEWRNPHAFIRIAVGAGSRPMTWIITCGSPVALERMGLTADLLKAGTEVTVDGYRYKNIDNWADGVTLTLKDGRRVPLSVTVVRDGVQLMSR